MSIPYFAPAGLALCVPVTQASLRSTWAMSLATLQVARIPNYITTLQVTISGLIKQSQSKRPSKHDYYFYFLRHPLDSCVMEQIFGHIERITFHNPETGYTVAQLMEPMCSHLACIVGILPSIQPGETVRCYGEWKQHLVYGKQFEVKECKPEVPATLVGIEKYLSSGLIPGIGPVFAKRIVDVFGIATLDVIEKTPDRLLEVQGLGKKRLDRILECWQEQRSIREIMVFLQGHQISPSYVQKIFKLYGKESIRAVSSNPYQLARDIRGIGFKSADKIAQSMGIEKDAPPRIQAAVEHTLLEKSDDGHVCFPLTELLKDTAKLAESPEGLVLEAIQFLQREERVSVFELTLENALTPFVWLKGLFLAEVGIARELKRLISAPSFLRSIDVPKAIEWVQKKLQIELAINQAKAVAMALEAKTEIITGGPGTGKSTITKAILAITEKLSDKILLAAPTGRAAKRMSEITGRKAHTIHSLLEFSFKEGGFRRNRKNPLECDLIIVDESSMIDTSLMFALLKATPPHSRVIFVGDINQLPSVGPGNVLRDMIDSHLIPVTILNEIYRQAAGSKIITNSHRINNGLFPDLTPDPHSDFFFLEAEEPPLILSKILGLVSQRLPKTYGFDPVQDIQVLAPMKKGQIGIDQLNIDLQKILNGRTEGIMRKGYLFSLGDKVMQIRNDYDKGVFNGDIGKIIDMDLAEQEVLIRFDATEAMYKAHELDDVALAYAVSIHKYQGSECPCVIIPLHTSHFMMLHRNLLYTGVTRGKKMVILVGTKKALAIAIKNDEIKRRYTGLKQALVGINLQEVR